jgi:hypothetical protein
MAVFVGQGTDASCLRFFLGFAIWWDITLASMITYQRLGPVNSGSGLLGFWWGHLSCGLAVFESQHVFTTSEISADPSELDSCRQLPCLPKTDKFHMGAMPTLAELVVRN